MYFCILFIKIYNHLKHTLSLPALHSSAFCATDFPLGFSAFPLSLQSPSKYKTLFEHSQPLARRLLTPCHYVGTKGAAEGRENEGGGIVCEWEGDYESNKYSRLYLALGKRTQIALGKMPSATPPAWSCNISPSTHVPIAPVIDRDLRSNGRVGKCPHR